MNNYSEPKTDYKFGDAIGVNDQNRIEKNIKSLKDENNEISGNNTYSGNNTFSGENEINGKVILSGEIDINDLVITGIIHSDFIIQPPA
jgi:flagellin-like hook-associated protein FlgL